MKWRFGLDVTEIQGLSSQFGTDMISGALKDYSGVEGRMTENQHAYHAAATTGQAHAGAPSFPPEGVD